MNWDDLKFHLQTALYVCATTLGFGLLGMLASRVLIP